MKTLEKLNKLAERKATKLAVESERLSDARWDETPGDLILGGYRNLMTQSNTHQDV